MPLLSHNCFVLRGSGDLYKCLCCFILPSPSPFMLFSGPLTPSVLFLPECESPLTALHITPSSAVRDYISGSEASAVRCKVIGKASSQLSAMGGVKGGVFTWFHGSMVTWEWSTSHHLPSWQEHAAVPLLRSPGGPANPVPLCYFTFEDPSSLSEFHLLSVPINLTFSQHGQSPCQPQTGLSFQKCGQQEEVDSYKKVVDHLWV